MRLALSAGPLSRVVRPKLHGWEDLHSSVRLWAAPLHSLAPTTGWECLGWKFAALLPPPSDEPRSGSASLWGWASYVCLARNSPEPWKQCMWCHGPRSASKQFARARCFFFWVLTGIQIEPGARGGTGSLLSMVCAHKRNCLPADLLYSEHNFLSFFMVMTMMWQCHLSSSECRCYRLNGFSLFKRLPIPLSSGSRMLEQSVGEWLESIGLQQYESKLLLNGFDDVRFLVSCWVGPTGSNKCVGQTFTCYRYPVSTAEHIWVLQPSRTVLGICRRLDKRKKWGLCWVRVIHPHI